MSNVWIINLKDNRDGHDKNDDTKFNTCFKSGIIAIGWGSDDSRKETSYVKAKSAIKKMKKGDLVWTKKPSDSNVLFLLRVTDSEPFDYFETCSDYFLEIDISMARKAEIISRFDSDNLPAGIEKHDIFARSTAEMVHEETRKMIINATNNYVASL